jgi:hypothetical protein
MNVWPIVENLHDVRRKVENEKRRLGMAAGFNPAEQNRLELDPLETALRRLAVYPL